MSFGKFELKTFKNLKTELTKKKNVLEAPLDFDCLILICLGEHDSM
jgi:hypothetical protein